MPAYPSVIKGYYNPEVEIFRGYWMITWFKKEFGIEEVLKAKEMDVSPEELLDHRLSEIPAGSQGLLLQPYWSPHVKTPIAKGAMIGFGEVHTRIHIYRAIVEGINYGLMDGMEKIESKSGIPITEIHVSGGGAQSDPVCQIAADMFGRKVYQPLECETSTIGAAMVGFVGLKIHENFEVAMQNMVHYKKIYEPNPQNHMIYRNLYKKAYQKIYPRLRQIYRDIKETIHYPAD
jgi:sugar (pentulose or hexulose) kinase